jgi:hypothetical protein
MLCEEGRSGRVVVSVMKQMRGTSYWAAVGGRARGSTFWVLLPMTWADFLLKAIPKHALTSRNLTAEVWR